MIPIRGRMGERERGREKDGAERSGARRIEIRTTRMMSQISVAPFGSLNLKRPHARERVSGRERGLQELFPVA